MLIKAIIIDDEERARDILASCLAMYCPDVEVIATASNVPDGVLLINQHKPDLVFLDVEMPEYNGFELLKFFSEINFEIIFVTAYSEHALTAFKVSAIDYILKPIDIDQLVNAVEKFKEKRHQSTARQRLEFLQETLQHEEIKRIALPMSEGLLFVEISEIVMLEADGSYTDVHLCSGSKILVSKKLKFFDDLLMQRTNFFRVHRSFIVNVNHMERYSKGDNTIALVNQLTATISRDNKALFDTFLRNHRLVN